MTENTKLLIKAELYKRGERYFAIIQKDDLDAEEHEIPPEQVPMLEIMLSQL